MQSSSLQNPREARLSRGTSSGAPRGKVGTARHHRRTLAVFGLLEAEYAKKFPPSFGILEAKYTRAGTARVLHQPYMYKTKFQENKGYQEFSMPWGATGGPCSCPGALPAGPS